MRKWKVRLSHKIMRVVLVSGAVMIGVTVLVTIFLVMPSIRREALVAAGTNIKLIVQQAEAKIGLIKSYASNVADSFDLKLALRAHYADPSSVSIRDQVSHELDNKKSEMPAVQKIAVQKYGGEIITTSRELTEHERYMFTTPEYKYFSGLDYATSFFYVYKAPFSSEHAWGNEPKDIYVATFCLNFYVDHQRYTLTLFVDVSEIIDATESLTTHIMDSYIWMDSFRQPFAVKEGDNLRELIEAKLRGRLFYNYESMEVDGGVLFMHTLNGSKWILGAFMSNATLTRYYAGTFLVSLCLFFALVIIVTLISLPIINRFTNPLRQLAGTMRKVALGDLSVVSNIKSNDEIEELSYGLNNMISKLNMHINKLIEKEKTEQRMKYCLLISEIDPHFIYNTMNTINYLARKCRYNDIIEINSALIRILQDRLRINNIEIYDSVSQEIDMIKQYMIIQQFRFNKNVDIVWEVDPQVLEEQVPKNILQPLVENALLHGLMNDEGEPINGYIKIQMMMNEEDLIIKVIDNGCGMPAEKIEMLNISEHYEKNIERGRHIGIQNIKERLAYLYGSERCFFISEQPGGGTCVMLKLKTKSENKGS